MALTQEEIQQIAVKVSNILATSSQGVGEVEVVTSVANVVSLPALKKVGSIESVVVVPLSLLKGADGKEVELGVTDTHFTWRYTEGAWQNLISREDMLQPAADIVAQLTTALNSAQLKLQNIDTEWDVMSSDVAQAILDTVEVAEHPNFISPVDFYVYAWNMTTKAYDKTDVMLKGEGFTVENVYTSIALMQADIANAKENRFYLINSDDVENPDNAKLYTFRSGAFQFLADMSGAIGFTGKTPQPGIGTVITGEPGSSAAVSLTEDGADDSGNPKFKLNFAIPAGESGVQIVNDISEANENASVVILSQGTENDIPYSYLSISSDEKIVGEYNLNGEKTYIYEKTVELKDLPSSANETKSYIIDVEPLGYGLYFNIESFVASAGKSLVSSFYNDNYKIVSYEINDDLNSIIVIKCVESVPLSLNGIAHIQYCKFDGNIVEFEVTVPNGVDKEAVTLEIPPLKYNKKMIYSHVTDDSYSIYQFIFSAINKRFVVTDDPLNFFHLNMSTEGREGYYPTAALQYTDGCGIKKRYATAVATWPDKLKDRYIGQDVGKYWPFMSEKEFKLYKDFGFAVMYHDLYQNDDPQTQSEFDTAMESTAAKFYEYVGVIPKSMQLPGNKGLNYENFSINNNRVQQISGSSEGNNLTFVYPFKNDFTLDKKTVTVRRIFYNTSDEVYKQQLLNILSNHNTTENKEDITWLISGAHRSGLWEAELFEEIHRLYGDIGEDNLWFTTPDEMYEYWYMRSYTMVYKTIQDNIIKYKLYVPKGRSFWYRSLSILLNGISSSDGVSVSSGDTVYGTSSGISDNKLLVNLDFNPDLLSKAEKYTSNFETYPGDQYAYDDAQYFVQQLKTGFREYYQARIDALSSPPVLGAVVINDNDDATQEQQVSVLMSLSGGATTHYRISENDDLTNVAWSTIVNPITFNLSSEYGNKTVYCQVKNIYGESEVKFDSIEYVEVDLSLQGILIDGGSSSTSDPVVSVQFNYTGSATHYMLSESLDFTGAEWIEIANPAIFTLSSVEYGSKTIYAKLQNTNTEIVTSAASASITLIDTINVVLSSISINGGSEYTGNANIVITPSFTNIPTHCRVGETSDMSTQAWQEYTSGDINYSLSGYGNKTIYLQLKNDTNESEIKSDTIEYIQAVVLDSVTLANGESSFEGVNVPVSLTVSGGTPTHYRAGVNSDLSEVTWLTYLNEFNYNFDSIGSKTLYVQIKNQVSESDILSDTVNLVEQPLTALIGFNGTNNTAVSSVDPNTGVTTTQTKPISFTSYGSHSIYDTAGNLLSDWKINLNTSFYAIDSVFTTAGSNFFNSVNTYAQSNTGVYDSSVFLAAWHCPNTANMKSRLSLTLPAGTYRIRLLWSSSLALDITEEQRQASHYIISQGGLILSEESPIAFEGFSSVDNVEFNSTLEFTILDGTIPVDIGLYNTIIGYRPGINLIEITKLS